MTIEKRSEVAIRIVDIMILELIDLEKLAVRERNFEVALQRFDRWKSRTVRQLWEKLSLDEAQRLERAKGKYDHQADDRTRLSAKVRAHLAVLQVLKEELEKYPDTSVSVPTTSETTADAEIPAGEKTATLENSEANKAKKVFVVHGRDEKCRKSMSGFLRALGLNPLEWTQVITVTGRPSSYIGEILDVAFGQAQAIVVLFTGDNEARLKNDLCRNDEPSYERDLTLQPRSNVIFEAGMAIGRHERRTILVQVGKFRPFSDIAGRHMTYLDNSSEKRQELVTKLIAAGCKVDNSGTDWLSEGNFD